MSLVPFNYSNNWSVVLRDNAKQALVLYDPSSQKLSLVNDPVIFSQLGGYQKDHSRALTSGSHHESICNSCGQPVPEGPLPSSSSSSPPSSRRRTSERRTASGSNSTSEVARNVEYFQLLESSTDTDFIENKHGISETAFSQGYFDRFFITKTKLGRGSRGAVFLVEHMLDGVSLGLFALKKVPVGDNHEWLEKVLAEVHLLRLLTHPNLVSYNHVWLESSSISSFAPAVPCAFILQEFCDGGTLEDYIRARIASTSATTNNGSSTKRERLRRQSESNNGGIYQSSSGKAPLKPEQLLTVVEILSFMRDITSGVFYLHRNHIIHRDLKPLNCLLMTSDIPGKVPSVLVSDFGEGQLEGTKRSGTGSTGTLEYCAPELIKPHGGRLSQFSKKTDIFSLGMILYYLCYSKLPYSADPWDELEDIDYLTSEVKSFTGFQRGTQTLTDRDDLPPGLYDLLTKCLNLDPKQRPTAEEILDSLELLIGDGGGTSSSIVEEEEGAEGEGGERVRETTRTRRPGSFSSVGDSMLRNNSNSLQLVQPKYLQDALPAVSNSTFSNISLGITPVIKYSIIVAELGLIYLEPRSLGSQLAMLVVGMQIATQSERMLLVLILTFVVISVYSVTFN